MTTYWTLDRNERRILVAVFRGGAGPVMISRVDEPVCRTMEHRGLLLIDDYGMVPAQGGALPCLLTMEGMALAGNLCTAVA